MAACQNNASLPNFFGTSAAAPHAAGIAALMLQANPGLTPTAIYQALRLSALPMTGNGPTPNFFSGYGFIQADAAFVVPTLALSSNAIALGSSSTLTWTSVDASSCTATGDWGGAQGPSGTVTLTPAVAGVTRYTLTCTNATGALAASTVSLSAGVTPAAPAAPTLSLGAASIVLGQSTTLTWTSTNASACAAAGSWNGAQLANGNKTLSPGAVGTYTYSLSCSNGSGSSPGASVTLAVTAVTVKSKVRDGQFLA